MTKRVCYREQDIVRLKKDTKINDTADAVLKQCRYVVQLISSPSSISYGVDLPGFPYILPSCILRRATEKEVQQYKAEKMKICGCADESQVDSISIAVTAERRHSTAEFKDLDTPCVDADAGSFSDTLKQLFQGIPNVPVEPLLRKATEQEVQQLQQATGKTAKKATDSMLSKMPSLQDIIKNLLFGFAATPEPTEKAEELDNDCVFDVPRDAKKEFLDLIERLYALASKHRIPLLLYAITQQHLASAPKLGLKNEVSAVAVNLERVPYQELHAAAKLILNMYDD